MNKIAFILLLGVLVLPNMAEAKLNHLCQAESNTDNCKKVAQAMYKEVRKGFINKTVALRKKEGKPADVKEIQKEADEFIPFPVFEGVFNKCGEKSADQKEVGKCMMDLFGDRAVSVLTKKYSNKTTK